MFRVIMTSCSLPFGPCALARKGVPGGLAPWAGDVGSENEIFFSPEGMSDMVLAWNGKSENLNSSITKS